MPPRRVEAESDSDHFISEDENFGRSKGQGKAKATGKGKRDTGKGKAKEVRVLSTFVSTHHLANETLLQRVQQAYAWEATYTRTWETVQEDEGGSLTTAVEDLLARGRRRLLLAPEGAIRRTIIRHLILLLDLSAAMLDRDMRPTRFDLTLASAREFVAEWFDQNPLGQIGVVGMRAGIGERVGEMSGVCGACNALVSSVGSRVACAGNPQDVLKAISERHKLEPSGEPSLQNAIEMARSSMR